MATQNKKMTNAQILNKLPKDADKILVKADHGKQKYIFVQDVTDQHEIVFKKDGSPVVTKSKMGRPKVDFETALVEKNPILKDPLVIQTMNNPDSSDVLYLIMTEIGKESADLKNLRNGTQDTRQILSISDKRIHALKSMADVWLKRKDQLVVNDLDLKSPAVGALVEFLLITMKTAMEECQVRSELIEVIFAKFNSHSMDPAFENDLKRAIKEASENKSRS